MTRRNRQHLARTKIIRMMVAYKITKNYMVVSMVRVDIHKLYLWW
jgi:hypothetical protein